MGVQATPLLLDNTNTASNMHGVLVSPINDITSSARASFQPLSEWYATSNVQQGVLSYRHPGIVPLPLVYHFSKLFTGHPSTLLSMNSNDPTTHSKIVIKCTVPIIGAGQ